MTTDRSSQPPLTIDGARWFEHRAMACVWGLLTPDEDERTAEGLAAAVFDEIDRLERDFSRFYPGSDVSRIAALAPGATARVSPDTRACLIAAERMRLATNGAFDVAFRTPYARDYPLVLHPEAPEVTVRIPDVRLDLGGIGKGYALDRAAALLRDWGVERAVLHAAQSTLYALGAPRDAAGWRVCIRGLESTPTPLGDVVLCDQAFSGSGVAVQGAHVVDPRSRQPARCAAAWAVATSATDADALSTALLSMSEEEISALLDEFDDAYALRPTDDAVAWRRRAPHGSSLDVI